MIIKSADIAVVALGIEITGARGQRQPLRRRRTVFRNTRLGATRHAVERSLGDDVDHARDRVGAIRGRRAIAQHLDPVDDVVGDGVEIDEVARRVVGQGVIGSAQAVEEHQGRTRRQTAQRHRRCATGEGAVGGERVRKRRTVVRRKLLNCTLYRIDATLIEVLGSDRRHGRGRRPLGAEDRTGDDDVADSLSGRGRKLSAGVGLRFGILLRIGQRLRRGGHFGRRSRSLGECRRRAERQDERRRRGEQERLALDSGRVGHW